MILLIDNYDSFVFNLARYFRELGQDAVPVRNDQITLEEIERLGPQAIVISPGPCTPNESGVSVDVVRAFAGRLPILGVCLGHQAISAAFGGVIVRAPEPVHGRTSLIHYDDCGLFDGLPNPFSATRYHSLIVDRARCPQKLTVTAWTEDGIIMALRHRDWPIFGVQFHPESILTECGHELLWNFLRLANLSASQAPPAESRDRGGNSDATAGVSPRDRWLTARLFG